MKCAHRIRTLLAVAAVMTAGAASAMAQGRIEFVGGNEQDWGVVQPGALSSTMVIRNAGDGELTITEVKPTCGCTTAQPGKNVLAPGDTTQVHVTMNVSGIGATQKAITVRTSDLESPVVSYHLKADVRPTMTFAPTDYFLVNNATVGVEYPASISIVNHGDKPFTVEPLAVERSNADIRFERSESAEVAPGETFELTAFITPKQRGSVTGLIKLRTSAEGYAEKDVHIWGSASEQATGATIGTSDPVEVEVSSSPER